MQPHRSIDRLKSLTWKANLVCKTQRNSLGGLGHVILTGMLGPGGIPIPGQLASQISLLEMTLFPAGGSSSVFKTVVSLGLMALLGASRSHITGLCHLLPTMDHRFIGSKDLLKILVISMPKN